MFISLDRVYPPSVHDENRVSRLSYGQVEYMGKGAICQAKKPRATRRTTSAKVLKILDGGIHFSL